jgi:hypothetical protein
MSVSEYISTRLLTIRSLLASLRVFKNERHAT